MSLQKKIERRNKGLRTVNSATAAILVGSVAATGAITAGLASGAVVANGQEQSIDQGKTDSGPKPQPPINAPQAAQANTADLSVLKAKKKAAKKAAQQAAAQAAADAAAAAAQQAAQQQQQKPAKSNGS